MTAEQARLERLQIEIELKRSALAEYKANLLKLQKELELFARQYDKALGLLEAQLDAVRQQIEALRAAKRKPAPGASGAGLWGAGYASFEESFNAKYLNPDTSNAIPAQRSVDEPTLRTLYRKLARQYHPDTTQDPAEKARRTLIMAQINAAYRAKDADALYALDGRRSSATATVRPLTSPIPRSLTYQELYNLSRQLDDELDAVKIEHNNLLHSPLMTLKIEYSLARGRGVSLLNEIANKIRAELAAARAELDALRR